MSNNRSCSALVTNAVRRQHSQATGDRHAPAVRGPKKEFECEVPGQYKAKGAVRVSKDRSGSSHHSYFETQASCAGSKSGMTSFTTNEVTTTTEVTAAGIKTITIIKTTTTFTEQCKVTGKTITSEKTVTGTYTSTAPLPTAIPEQPRRMVDVSPVRRGIEQPQKQQQQQPQQRRPSPPPQQQIQKKQDQQRDDGWGWLGRLFR